jgi:hypothetical protein
MGRCWCWCCWLPLQWFTAAGFTDIKLKRIGPKWYRGVRRHGLIMGCSVTGVKPQVRRRRQIEPALKAWVLLLGWAGPGCARQLPEYSGWYPVAALATLPPTGVGDVWWDPLVPNPALRQASLKPALATLLVMQAGESPLQLGPKAEVSKASNTNPVSFLFRLLLGSTAGFYYFMLPWYMWIKNLVWPKNAPGF